MNLKYYTLLIFIPLFFGCGSKLSEKEKWREMSCGLYMNSNSEIAFATQSLKINNDTTKIDGEKCPNIYITNINDTIPLKNIIDTLTFKHIGSTFFKDTNYVYNYYQICDGGFFNIYKPNSPKIELLNDYYIRIDNEIHHFRKGPLDVDFNTFRPSNKYPQLASDKDHLYYFGEKMTDDKFKKNVSQEEYRELKQDQFHYSYSYINTDTTEFSSGSKVFWLWDRDSSWLTFETFSNKKMTLMTLYGPTIDLTERLGLFYLKEYPNFALFQHNWISGCCTPPDYILLNKKNGQEIERISNAKLIWFDDENDYIMYFKDDNNSTIECFNLKTNKKTQTMFKPKNELFFSDNDNYPSNSFKLPTKVSENNIYIEYSYYFDKLKDSVSYEVIKIKRPRK